MDYNKYIQLFDDILAQRYTEAPYHQQSFVDYVKLNQTRSGRWLKTGKLTDELIQTLQQLDFPLHWVLITEPWCGDSAHIAPFIHLMALQNEHIGFEVHLRDQGTEIESYLTNGTRSIPVLIIRDESGKDLAVWGARPKACVAYRQSLLDAGEGGTEMKLKIQQWYNEDKGQSFMHEMHEILQRIIHERK